MCSLVDRLKVLMISTPNRKDLVFPKVREEHNYSVMFFICKKINELLLCFDFLHLKGGWENDETIYEAACREVLEEAGVKGIINVMF
jgi:diphosphoinositol-polyphosphate diphosphatase